MKITLIIISSVAISFLLWHLRITYKSLPAIEQLSATALPTPEPFPGEAVKEEYRREIEAYNQEKIELAKQKAQREADRPKWEKFCGKGNAYRADSGGYYCGNPLKIPPENLK